MRSKNFLLRHAPGLIVLVYMSASILWILFSDRLVIHFIPDHDTLALVMTAKGAWFVVVTGVSLYVLLRLFQAEDARQRRMYETFFESNALPMLLVDPATQQIRQANAKAHAYYGFPGRELESRTVGEINAEGFDYAAARIAEALHHGRRCFQFRHRLAGGEVREVEVFSGPVEVDGKQFVLSSINDVTESRRQARRLRRTEERFRVFMSHMPLPVCVLDRDGRYVMVNPAWEESSGITAAQIVGQGLERLGLPAEDARRLRAIHAQVLDSDTGMTSEEFFLRRGQWRHLQVIRFPLPNNGDARELGIITLDVTERVEREVRLEDARQATEAACEAKNQFLANMSHELRTPLNGIMGLVELLLLEDSGNGTRSEMLKLVKESAERLLAMIQDLLSLSQLSTGHDILCARPFALRQTLDSISRSFAVQARLKGLDFSVEVAPELRDHWQGDDIRLRQLCINLLSNAVRFTERGAVRLFLEPWGECPPGLDGLAIRVVDTGPGIASDKLAEIFEPFAIGEAYLTKRHGGAGLGLSIARQIVELMGGDIRVQSAQGQGSTFIARICLVPMPETPAQPGSAAQDVPPGVPDGARLTILYAEDERISRMFLSQLLQFEGHRVLEACNGEEALRMLSGSSVDLVLMDIQMPVMDGILTAKAIRQGQAGEANRKVPIIAVTAYAGDEDRRKVLAAGMDGFLAKPLDYDELRSQLARMTS